MSNVFTLDSLREETKKKFEPVKIELSDGSEVILRALVRLPSESRKAVSAAIEDFNDVDQEDESDEGLDIVIDLLSTIFSHVADRPKALLEDLGVDEKDVEVTLLTNLLMLWARETQLGEAANSPV